jgi:hypothetical protein
VGLEPILAALVTLLGIALTWVGVFNHTGPAIAGLAIAPGGLLALVGGGWLGTALARRHVRLLPGARIDVPDQADGEAAA